jgi:hypothetical protein
MTRAVQLREYRIREGALDRFVNERAPQHIGLSSGSCIE